ncbi:hypothetical protein [Oceaniglobus roseus]|uniref:hypothetical protein n=1 Tax=Oceaniglobus roseus TaxID=1737570 RepID=UPI000C7EE44F|nr:hypothetical protein [Kandeliimicrobium roseum]
MAADRAARRLESLLEEERAALVAGALDRLEGIARRKPALLDAVGKAPPDKARLDRLLTLGRRNEHLLVAARQGLSAVRDRLEQVARGSATRIYSADGARQDLGCPVGTLHRRA